MVSIFVILSIFAFIAESHPQFKVIGNKTSVSEVTTESAGIVMDNHESSSWIGLEYIDYCCLAFFSLDLAIRFSCTPNRTKFLKNIITIIEIISVIPYYVDIFGHYLERIYNLELSVFLKIVHILRIFGVLRIFKILRYYSGLQVLIYTLRSSYKDLLLMLTFIGVATLFFSTLIYHVDDRNVFTSIPAGFWWSIITMTTVGYGDIYPKYIGGYIIGSACSLVGVLVVAFTVPILVNSFMLYYSHAQSMLMIRQEHNVNSMTEDERIYLNHTLTTLKRMSFYSFLPNFDNAQMQKKLTIYQTDNGKRSSPIGECKEDILFHNQTATILNDRPTTLDRGVFHQRSNMHHMTSQNYF